MRVALCKACSMYDGQCPYTVDKYSQRPLLSSAPACVLRTRPNDAAMHPPPATQRPPLKCTRRGLNRIHACTPPAQSSFLTAANSRRLQWR